MEIIERRTPLGIEQWVWKDKVLVRLEDLSVAEVIDIRARSEELKTLLTPSPDVILPNSRPMWEESPVPNTA